MAGFEVTPRRSSSSIKRRSSPDVISLRSMLSYQTDWPSFDNSTSGFALMKFSSLRKLVAARRVTARAAGFGTHRYYVRLPAAAQLGGGEEGHGDRGDAGTEAAEGRSNAPHLSPRRRVS